jgi:hypothetical protein
MNIVIIQEAGRHEENKEFRESLNLKRALSRIPGVTAIVWGLNFPYFNNFVDIEKWADVIFVIENYTSGWLPLSEISKSKKLKIFWSIDSHVVLGQHQQMCKGLNIDILLNSTERYLPMFDGLVKKSYWFPNAYPDDLIYPMDIEKGYDVGFCGSIGGDRPQWMRSMSKFNIKQDGLVIGNSMVKAINSYKIHFNRNVADDINYRTFETAGCKTFLITNYTPGLEKLFKIGEEIETYDTMDDLNEKIEFYLNNESKRKEIEEAGYKRSKSEHTYFERAKTLVDIIKKPLN